MFSRIRMQRHSVCAMLFGLFVTSNDAAELPDVAAAFALNPTRVTLFPNRYAWRPCSLVAETGGDVLNKACKVAY